MPRFVQPAFAPRLTPAPAACLALLLAACLAAPLCAQTPAPGFEAGMDDGSVWVLVPGPEGHATRVLHRPAGFPDTGLTEVHTLTGRVKPGAAVAVGNVLWVVYTDGLVHTIHFQPAPNAQPHRPGTYAGRLRGRMPGDVTVLSLTAGRDGPWALVRVKSRETLKQLEAQAAKPQNPDQPRTPRDPWIPGISDYGLKRGTPKALRDADTPADPDPGPDSDTTADGDAAAADPESTEQPRGESGSSDQPTGDQDKPDQSGPPGEGGTETDADRPSQAFEDRVFLPQDRLLQWTRRGWVVVDLPEDWPDEARGYVTLPRRDAAMPDLVAVPADVGGVGVWVYRWRDRAWSKSAYPDAPLSGGTLRAVGVDGQVVLTQKQSAPQADELVVEATLLRGGKATRLGMIEPGVTDTQPWRIAGQGDRVTLIARDESPPPDGATPDEQDAARVAEGIDIVPTVVVKLASVGLDGRRVDEPETVVEEPTSWAQAPGQLLLMAVFLLSTVMLFVFWQRDREGKQVQLPRGVRLVDPGRRFMAGAVDLLPCVVGAFLAFGVPLTELPSRWPGLMGEVAPWDALLPGLIAIGLFVIHTTVGELAAQKSVGKWLLGVRVSNLTGGVPRPWQVLVRNVLKTFDLVALPLLLLPLIGPFGQRLGDLVAGTVVVAPATDDDAAYEDDPDA